MSFALDSESAHREPFLATVLAQEPAARTGAAGAERSLSAADDRQAAIVALGRRAIASCDVSLLLQDAVSLLAETLGAQMSGVAEILPDGETFVLRLASAEDNDRPALMQESSLDKAQSLAGYTLSVAHPVVVSDFSSEARFSDTFLRGAGVRSAICCPLRLLDQSFGGLAVYGIQPGQFTDGDAVFVEAVAHLVTTTIGRDRLVKELDRERRFARSVLTTIESIVLTLSPDGRVLHANSACESMSGFSVDEIRNRPVWNTFLPPEDVSSMLAAFDQIRRGQKPGGFSTNLVTKHGSECRVAWTLTVLEDQRGNAEGVIATGVDLTQQMAVEAQLREALETVEELRRELTQVDGASTAQAFQTVGESDGSERREKPRRAYPYIQLVAPIVDGQLPPRDSFKEVNCRDISAGGFSFTSSWIPQEKSLVAAFGSGKSLIFLVAEVVHTRPTQVNGKPAYLNGCRYTGRATY